MKHFIVTGSALCALTLSNFAAQSPARAAWPQNSGASVPRVWRANDVVNAIGVNTHIGYIDTVYGNTPSVIGALRYLGVTTVRDSLPILTPDDPRMTAYYQLLSAGFKMQLVFPSDTTETHGYPNVVAAAEAGARNIVRRFPGQVTGIEGTNEPDLQNDQWQFRYAGLAGAPAVARSQIDLYAAVKADPLLSSIPVWEFSLNSPPYDQRMYESVYSANPAVMQAFDVSNRGIYSGVWSPQWMLQGQSYNALDVGYSGKSYVKGALAARLNSLPLGVKEVGLTGASHPIASIEVGDETAQAKIMPSEVFDTLIMGSIHSNIYELFDIRMDNGTPNAQNHFGLFDNAMHPKPVAGMLRNILGHLQDTAPAARTFTPTPLNVSIYEFPLKSPGAVDTGSGFTMVTQKSDQSYTVLVWYEPLLVDQKTYTSLPVPAPVPVNVFLGKTCGQTTIYDPLTDKTIAGPANSSRIPVALPDHIVMVTCANPH